MKGGVCSATSSVEKCLFFDIDVKGGERSQGVKFEYFGNRSESEWSNAEES
jgi:hypothetical protein